MNLPAQSLGVTLFVHLPRTPQSQSVCGHVGANRRAGSDKRIGTELDRRNEALLERVNRSGRFFLSHTKLRDRFTLRLTLGNLRATERHVEGCWALLRESVAG